jgi:hypothetical protein
MHCTHATHPLCFDGRMRSIMPFDETRLFWYYIKLTAVVHHVDMTGTEILSPPPIFLSPSLTAPLPLGPLPLELPVLPPPSSVRFGRHAEDCI